MSIVALLTGKGNNKLKGKNLIEVKGKPLLAYPAEAAKKVGIIDDFFVSSDDDKILNVAEDIGYRSIVRPVELAAPESQHVDVIIHALKVMEEEHQVIPEILVVLLANTVSIKASWIETAIEYIQADPTLSAAVPVYQDNDHHPYRAKRVGEGGVLDTFFDFQDANISTNRQDLTPCYYLCHNFWVLNISQCLKKNGQPPWFFMGDRVKPIVVGETYDVHAEQDILLSEIWLDANSQDLNS
jgi:CMP-N,N'-diacetyllegionaminic acid synthase